MWHLLVTAVVMVPLLCLATAETCHEETVGMLRQQLLMARFATVSSASYWQYGGDVLFEAGLEIGHGVMMLPINKWEDPAYWHTYVYEHLRDRLHEPSLLLIDAPNMTSLSQLAWAEGFCKRRSICAEGICSDAAVDARMLHVVISSKIPFSKLQDGATRPAFIARLYPHQSQYCGENIATPEVDVEPNVFLVPIPQEVKSPPVIEHVKETVEVAQQAGQKRKVPVVVKTGDVGKKVKRTRNMEKSPAPIREIVQFQCLDRSGIGYAIDIVFDMVLGGFFCAFLLIYTVLEALGFGYWFIIAFMWGALGYVLLRIARTPALMSHVIEKMMRRPDLKPELVRTTFNDLPYLDMKVAIDHTHGIAAADRSGASCFIDRLADSLGRKVYFYQRSRSDERNRRSGSREYFWIKDLNTKVVGYEQPDNCMLAMVDVDQYVDMPSFLCGKECPTILYTFQPSQVSRESENYVFTFNKENEVQYTVTGGGLYTHKVWNYSMDNMMVVKRFMGIPYKTTAYLIDRRSTSVDHELILLTPLGTWGIFMAWFVALALGARVLQRLEVFVKSGFLRLRSVATSGSFISTGRPGELASAKIPTRVDDTIATIARISKYDLTMPQVQSYVDGDKEKAAILVDYHRNADDNDKPPVVCPVPEGVRRYQFDPSRYEPEAKAGMVAFMSPLIHGAYVPDQTVANEERCVTGRVVDVRPKILRTTPFLRNVMHEFVEMFIPQRIAHTLDPTDDDEVRDRQSKPSQRRIYDVNQGAVAKRLVQMFIKKEPYGKVADPRAISQINGVDKIAYSKYTYALEAVLKEQKWYAFGKNPLDVANRVVEVVQDAEFVVNTDFSRFDGHGSNLMRELEKMVLLRAFRETHHNELIELHRSQQNMKAYATLGTKYETHFSRASGSPETSLFNSIVNAFVAFLALRMTKREGLFVAAHEAYARLGIYGGDDGLTADVEPDVYRKAASMIGQKLEAEPIMRYEFGVKFLARMYSPYVWEGDNRSCCDLQRQLTKFHVTVRLPSDVTPQMKLLEKARSFLLSDRSTPVLGDFCRRVETLSGGKIKPNHKTAQVASWLASFPEETQYPNEPDQWMIDYMVRLLPKANYTAYLKWLNKCRSLEDLMRCGLLQEPEEPETKVPAVVDGEIFPRNWKPEVLETLDDSKHGPTRQYVGRIREKPKIKFEDLKLQFVKPPGIRLAHAELATGAHPNEGESKPVRTRRLSRDQPVVESRKHVWRVVQPGVSVNSNNRR